MRVVAELALHPGREDQTESGPTGVDLSVPLSAEMLGHRRPDLLDLGVQVVTTATWPVTMVL